MGSTTMGDITRWFLDGKTEPSLRYMLVCCDTFDYEDFPIYVSDEEDVHDKIHEYQNKPMSRVHEVYDLLESLDSQIDLRPCWKVPPR